VSLISCGAWGWAKVVDVAHPAGHPGEVTEPGFAPSDTPLGVDGVETAVFDGEAVLFHEDAAMVHRLNAVAGAVWLLCDGETTVASMPDELAGVFDVPADDLVGPIAEALDGLAAAGLLVGQAGPIHLPLIPEPHRAADGTPILVAPPDP
jgi:hypothetical protein